MLQAALRLELEREKAMEKIDADGYQRVVLYDGKREHDMAFRGRKVGSSQKADAWLTPEGDDRGLRPPRAGAVYLRRVRRVRR